jgi:hypothetical protein
MKITNIEIIKKMFMAGAFSLREPSPSMFTERTEEGIIEYLPDGSYRTVDNDEIYFSFLAAKKDIQKDVLRAWGYQ